MVKFALPRHVVALALASLTLIAACGTPASSTTGGSTSDVGGNFTDLTSGSDSGKDTGFLSDGGSDGIAPGTDAGPDDTGSDVDTTGTDATDMGGGCEFPAKPLVGEPGSACKTSDECDSGACVDGPAGKICTSTCSACCPTGFKCEPFQTSGGDSVQVCLPKWNAICRPCEKDAECGKLGKDSLCVSYAGAGSFCGGACQSNSDCPADFACEDAQGEKGAGKQCVRTKGECACSPSAIADGAQTVCSIQNSAGTCSAIRKCTLSGLSACGAATPAAESCGNGVDDDCNGETDEDGAAGCTQVWSDGDGDKDGKLGTSSKCLCTPAGLYTATTATDCDDSNKAVNGSAVEVCDGIDNNCDGKTDEGCDDDGDGYCDVDMAVVGTPLVCKKPGKDCDDSAGGINPGMQEQCGNFIDDDCDGLTDSGPNVTGCVPFYADNDSDGFGAGDPVCQCAAKGIFSAVKTGDCADNDPKINPGATELCGDQKDDDCNGLTDEANAQGCTNYYVDLDGDSFGTATPTCLCAADSGHSALKTGDCDDSLPGVNPATAETCNGLDDNCNGTADEMGASGCTTYYVDADGDTFGNPVTGLCLCQKTPFNTTATAGDCNDDTTAAHPGALETCDGLDNNCDGTTDEADAQACTAFYADGDNDGFGDSTKTACLCNANAAFKVAKLGDCNDADASINPNAKELCDGVDNNCTLGVDEPNATGCSVFLRDHDGDNYGVQSDSFCLCGASGEFTAVKPGDCNDNDKTVNPKALEVCDGFDNDCDGVTDPVNADGCSAWYVDKDGDQYGTYAAAPKCLCAGIAGYAGQGGDCADNDATVNPGAKEVCNGKDDDCDGVKDPKNTSGCVAYYVDMDNDAYGANGLSQCQCAPDGAFSATMKDDCNDTSATINPGMPELCNGIDDNCNAQIDEGLVNTYYTDADLDGYGVTASGVPLCGPDATHKVATGGDCDDTKFAVNPGAAEVCNGADDNCNSQIDEGLATATYYIDADTDGYGTGAGNTQCGPVGSYVVAVPGDCNDSAKTVNPGAAEICDGLDNNCNTQVDEGLPVTPYFQDIDGDGYGTGAGTSQCGPINGFTVTVGLDCNDNVKAINPAVSEACGNNLDDNCNGATDEGCLGCTPTPLVDFENADVSAWTLAANWALYGPPAYKNLYSLEFSDVPGVHGYSPGASGTASTSVTVPAGTTAITVSVNYQAFMVNNCVLFFCSDGIDTKTTVTLSALGSTATIAAGSTPGAYELSLPLAVVPTKPTAITMTLGVVNTDGGLFSFHSSSSKGYIDVDNIRTTCP